jgi:hypothetical protein
VGVFNTTELAGDTFNPRNSSYQPDVSNEVAHTVGDER